ncbi:MAG: PDC sensor domain-containing protein, partial [Bacteriovorax sp.]
MNQELRQILKEVIHLFKNQKYRRIFLISFAFTIFFAAAAGYELVTSYQLELKRAKTQAINLSQVLEEEMSGTFKRIDLVMQEIVRAAQDKHVAEQLKRTDILDLISERSKDVPESKTFFIVDKNGFDVFRKKDGKNLFFGDRDYFMDQKKSTEDRLIISRPFIGRMSGVPVIGLSRRIINEKKEFMGIVAATVPLSYFSNLYSKFDIGSEGTITLFSNENIAYVRYPQNDFVGKRLFNEDIIDEMATKKESV